MNDLYRGGALRGVNFERAPFLVIWEVTQTCDLACVHCPAEAKPNRDPQGLSTPEGFQLLEKIGRFGHPLFVFTGGDPLKREDIFDLIARAKGVGLPTGFSPSGTSLLTYENLRRAKETGLDSLSISIDGSSAQTHDSFRQVPGSFDSCLRGAKAATELGLDLQINTTVTRYNHQELAKIADLVAQLEAKRWSVFFLVPTGRGREEDEVSPWEYERILHWLYDLSKEVPFRIKTTEAQHYRRVVTQCLAQEEGIAPEAMLFQAKSARGRFLPGISIGRGSLFISHVGDIYPSGFLPLAAGNVRQDSLVEIYRHSSLFRQLRDPSRLKGRCGICEYRFICGGSRARAYALTGDYLAEDAYCVYQPEGSQLLVEKELDSLDRRLLDLLQTDFPLVVEPFSKLADALSLGQEEVLERVCRMKEIGLIRQISAIFDSLRLGYRSTLAAFSVDDEHVDEVAILVNAHSGVSHNYARNHLFNLWFTLTLPPGEDLEAAVTKLAKDAGVQRYLVFPALRVFKIGGELKISEEATPTEVETQSGGKEPFPEARLAPSDIPVVKELQEDLHLVPRPFAAMAQRLGMSEEELLVRAKGLKKAGIMRRHAAVLRHRKAGFSANAMGCWIVPAERVEEVGRFAASSFAVSHCYERPAYPPHGPYNLFTMIHAHNRQECEEVAGEIAERTGIRDYLLLYSTKEHKKGRVRYFVERR